MHHSSDAESLDDEFDSGEAEDSSYYSDGSGGYDYDFCLDTATDYSKAKNYSILKEEDIRRLQANDIARVSSVFSISKVAASILLCHYNWSVSKVDDAWFNDEDRVRSIVGLLENPVVRFSKAKELTCGICFDSYPRDSIDAAACGHPYCSSCWTGYITTSINDGPACLSLKCPDPSCGAAIGQDMINRHASDEDKEKYSCYLLRSYIEDNNKMKWCPAPGCEYAVNFESGGAYDVSCLCSHNFCWNCAEEAHRPVDCNTVKKWVLKNNAESNTVDWIIANSKPCPNCKRPIEKGQGCMHMVCSLCKYEFCWLCLINWSSHNWSTGGYYACNIYQAAKRRGDFDETEKKREMARSSLERYTHYYERWAANRLSREKALVDLQKAQDIYLERISVVQCQPESQLKFITEAMVQIVECRRVLKWAYAYGYFIPENERAKRQFFEYLQGEAESGLERLHQCAENELQTFLHTQSPPEDFSAFRSKLIVLTSVTGNYFENLAEALENGLEDVDTGKTKGSSLNGEANKGKGRKGRRAKS